MFTPPKNYLPLLIAVGPSGCYKADLSGYDKPFDTFRKYRLYIKHVPYKVFPQIKEIVTQDWPDEHGEDVWLPPSGVVNKAYDLDTELSPYVVSVITQRYCPNPTDGGVLLVVEANALSAGCDDDDVTAYFITSLFFVDQYVATTCGVEVSVVESV